MTDLRQLFHGIAAKWKKMVDEIRGQIDKTGLFPDLKGEAGSSLRASVASEGALSKSYMLMCALSAGIATLGLLQSSTAVVIGAMLISPLMGPIAATGFAFASIDGERIRESVRVVAIGAVIGILTAVLLTWLSPIRNATPEIIARTEPTLLDLAIAILSGVAGAYATVQGKGATAIGVAIATALMPPLATVGYGLGSLNLDFAMGAFLLFLTNLAAIAFSFALVARLSGAARPLAHVEITVRHIIAGTFAFLILAAPLALTLLRVTRETGARSAATEALKSELNIRSSNIAQMEVRWPLAGQLSVDAVIVSPSYRNDAETLVTAKLTKLLGTEPKLNLQQVVAADIQSQTRAIVDAAVQRSAAGIAQDVPPLLDIRRALGLPTQALWINRTERTVQIVPFAASGWKLADYRLAEQAAGKVGSGWQVHVIPPVQANLYIALPNGEMDQSISAETDVALWAVNRWGMQGLTVEGVSGDNVDETDKETALRNAELIKHRLAQFGITATALPATPSEAKSLARGIRERLNGVNITIVPRPPSVKAEADEKPDG